MSKQRVSQELFLNLKEKLDNHQLTTNFPIEVTPLLHKLLQLIDNSNPNHAHLQPGSLGQGLSAALRHQMSRILKQNNKLHMDLMTAKEEIQSLNHRLYKFDANKHIEEKESSKLVRLKEQREQELIEQLRQVRFKYNELMDFIHQDPQNERQYIKRLMKHKHSKAQNTHAQEFKESNHQLHHHNDENNSNRIRQLQSKVKNRQAQILRLQNLLQYDGMNMNKIVKNFQDSLSKNKLKDADHKINFLEQSVDNIRKENTNMKNKNGSKQALRAEVQKCHSIISKLREQNQKLARNHKQQEFDVNKSREQHQRKVEKIRSQKEQVKRETQRNKQHISQLEKKIAFLQRQGKHLREELQQSRKRLAIQSQNLSAQHKKNQQLKVFYQYQLDTYKKKLHQVQFEAQQLKLANQQLLHQHQITRRESQLRLASINNLQKIVAQLMRKNSLLSDNTVGIIEQSLRKNEDIEARRQLVDLQQQLIHAQNQRQQLLGDKNALEHRFGGLVKQHERLKLDLGRSRGEISHKDTLFNQIVAEFEQAKLLIKKTQYENSKQASQLSEIIFQKDAVEASLKHENERLLASERSLRAQLKELQIRSSEEQGVLEITKIKLNERQQRLRHVEKLLNQSVEQSKKLSSQLAELDQKNHELTREKHRVSKKFEQLRKESEDFKNSSFKNYEQAINDNLNEVNALKKQISRLVDSEERTTIRYEEVSNLLNLVRKEKQVQQVQRISLCRENEHLSIRVKELQQIQRALVIENESLRNIARRN